MVIGRGFLSGSERPSDFTGGQFDSDVELDQRVAKGCCYAKCSGGVGGFFSICMQQRVWTTARVP